MCKLKYISPLKKSKFRIFNNDFNARLQKVTDIGYIWNYLGQGQIYKLKNITYLS